MSRSPAVILYDAAGTPLAVADGVAIPVGTRGLLIAGSDGTNARFAKVTSYGRVVTDGSEVTQPISATALPLPTGATTETTLVAIKDTAGVKKITDQLPAGTNEIGKVAQGTKAAGTGAWPEVLYDASGNVVGVVLEGSVYRLQTQAVVRGVVKGATPAGDCTTSSINADRQALDVHNWGLGTGNSQQCEGLAPNGSAPVGNPVWIAGWDGTNIRALDTVSGVGRLKATLYTADGDPVAFPSSSRSIKNDFAKNGTASSLLVNGSVTPVVFEYAADATYDVSLQEMKFTLVANSITFGSDYFGGVAGPLTNGLLVEVITGGITVVLYTLTVNEGFVNFASPGGFEWVVSSKDLMSSTYLIGGGLKLTHGAVDKVRVTVRDNISAAGVYFKCFVKGNLLATA